jgi:BirA family biotin operon repressor/biotin-[acetyl-CoA-carboxylase] ligase
VEPLRPRAGTGRLGGTLVHLRRTGSTNDAARDAARRGAVAGTVYVAEHQEAGRGRQGRTWVSAPGLSLTLSALVRTKPEALPLLPLVAAVAVCEACEAVAPAACHIKWPNDVWIDGRKAAGVLIEARPQEGWAVIGVGLNVGATADDLGADLRETATSLRIASGAAVPRDAVLCALFDRLAERLADLESGRAPDLLDRYRERDVLTGRDIEWTVAGESHSGKVQGIDERGNLVVVRSDGERHALESGEVHLVGRPQTADRGT